MPRIVPSQVVAAIDQLFPFAAKQPVQRTNLNEGHAAYVAAHLELITADTAARRFHDLIHPDCAARLGQKCNRATAPGALAAVEAVAGDLTTLQRP